MRLPLIENRLNARIETPNTTVSVEQVNGWLRIYVQNVRGSVHRKVGSPGSDEDRLCEAIALMGIKIRPRSRPRSGPKGGRPKRSRRPTGPRLPGGA